jgi:poly(ribitol-phosphate) beta-N-acetylglucosaminyltransferase
MTTPSTPPARDPGTREPGPGAPAAGPLPDVTVVLPVYNSMPYLVTCLASLMEQTLDRARWEVVGVDDGSTDGSGEQLDLVASRWSTLRVVHIPGSGGPSRPRNVGLEGARGRYVFFLDADDYLGSQALERMVGQADRLGSDLVTCRRRVVSGRKESDPRPRMRSPRHDGVDAARHDEAFRRGDPLRDLFIAFSDCKHLFRRSRIEQLGLRFREDLRMGEDALFTGSFVLLESLSTVVDYDCYYERLRDDGQNITTLLGATDEQLRGIELNLAVQRDRPELGWRPDSPHLHEALMDITRNVFNDQFVAHDLATRRRMVAHAADIMATWLTPRALAGMEALDRVKIDLLRRGREAELTGFLREVGVRGRGPDVVRGGRVYAGYPFLGDPVVGVSQSCYDVTAELPVRHRLVEVCWEGSVLVLRGHAYIEHVSTVQVSTAVVLRERYGRGERRCPVRVRPAAELVDRGEGRYDYGCAGFEVRVDTGALDAGTWAVFLAVGAQGVVKQVPLGGHRDPAVDQALLRPDAAGTDGAGVPAVAFTSYGTLTLTVPDTPGDRSGHPDGDDHVLAR